MILTEILNQHRNDFTGTLKCSHCETEHKLTTGYLDDYYLSQVIPGMFCPNCSKNEASEIKPMELNK